MGRPQRSRRIQISCAGLRLQEMGARAPCPIRARIRISATLHPMEHST